jgi:hypothetical protein
MTSPTPEQSKPTITAQLGRALGFVALTLALYLAGLVVSSKVRCGQFSLLQCLTRNYVTPGGQFQSLRRFREASTRGHVDVVFFGSSHAYRGFDPRLFAARGLTSQNLGSTYQTPLSTLPVAEIYLPKLTPKLVIFEVYYQTLAADGLESTRDLAANTPASWPMTKMALKTFDLGAIGFATAKQLGLTPNEALIQQAPQPDETFVDGGYIESTRHRSALEPGAPLEIALRDEQIARLKDVTAFTLATGARALWVMHPLPEDHLARIPDRAALHAQIDRAAREAGVDYWDFDERMKLDPLLDYTDFHHLSASGVARFNAKLIEDLGARGVISPGPPSSPQGSPPLGGAAPL